ncbi:hypothetical protein MJ1HA_0064 [Metallosphaera sedula]|nr:hypothetical protein MJ1HA_0064 [Metallosphaera sedula]
MIGHLWEEHVRDDESIDISEHTPDEFYSVVSGK